MRHNAVTNSEIDTLFAQRGEVDCDGKNREYIHQPINWRQMQRTATRTAMERRAYLDAQHELNKELLL